MSNDGQPSRPTFTVQPLVEISLRGVPRYDPRHAICPDDQRVVRALVDAMAAGTLPYPERHRTAGGGVYVAGWHPDDAPKIIEWLAARADHVDEHPRRDAGGDGGTR